MKFLTDNFTKNELKIILFAVAVLATGFTVKLIKNNSVSDKSFDYKSDINTFREINRKNNYQKETITQEEKNLLLRTDSLLNSEKKKLKSTKEEKLAGRKININTADKETLSLLPGVGEATAEKIIKYREKHKGFKKAEDIMKVKSIGKKKFEKMKDYITVE